RARGLFFLSQIVTSDGAALLQWQELNDAFPGKDKYNHTRLRSWYSLIKNEVSVSRATFRLKPEFSIHEQHLPKPVIPLINNSQRSRDWVATWSPINNTVIYGRSLTKYQNGTMRITHWIQHNPSTEVTPISD